MVRKKSLSPACTPCAWTVQASTASMRLQPHLCHEGHSRGEHQEHPRDRGEAIHVIHQHALGAIQVDLLTMTASASSNKPAFSACTPSPRAGPSTKQSDLQQRHIGPLIDSTYGLNHTLSHPT